jgi:hypothetical protein
MRIPRLSIGRFDAGRVGKIRSAGLFAVVFALLTASPSALWAHGSVVDGGEGCVIQFDFYSAHFSIFQPQTRQHREFCEDLPDVAESVFVLEYRHDSLREVSVDFRIMRNTSALGRFVRWSDIEAMGDLDSNTIFYQRSPAQTDGVLSILHTFTEPGDYVGIVSAPHPTLDQVYHAVFPFRVGLPWWQNRWLWLAAAMVIFVAWRRTKKQQQTGYRRLA